MNLNELSLSLSLFKWAEGNLRLMRCSYCESFWAVCRRLRSTMGTILTTWHRIIAVTEPSLQAAKTGICMANQTTSATRTMGSELAGLKLCNVQATHAAMPEKRTHPEGCARTAQGNLNEVEQSFRLSLLTGNAHQVQRARSSTRICQHSHASSTFTFLAACPSKTKTKKKTTADQNYSQSLFRGRCQSRLSICKYESWFTD